MHGVFDLPEGPATNADGKSAVEEISGVKFDVDWFSEAARRLHPHKPGTILFLTTGLGDERQCQKYAAGDTRPPAYFLRALLRSEQGWQWLSAVMEGCDAEWWRDLQRARRRSAKIDEADKG